MIFRIVAIAVSPFHMLLNHAWQSTIFVMAVAGLLLAFRNAPARVRCWLWTAASLKFLIPFSALVWLGGHMGWSAASQATLPWTFTIDEISSPFNHSAVMAVVAHPSVTRAGLDRWAGVIWAAGFVLTLSVWGVRWLRLWRQVRSLPPVADTPVVGLFGRLHPERRVRLVPSTSLSEPGVFGIFRPVLVLPAGILEKLTEPQLEAVLLHELAHVRRRDNLIAVLHMLVEAIFWFHPLVWWLGARQLEERERACDESVLEQFHHPRAYAQGILEVCRHYLESPVPCVAGVTGANLRKRIEHIMKNTSRNRLDFGRKLLLWAAGASAIVGPVTIGLLDAPRGRAQSGGGAQKEFEVASVKPMEPAMGGMMRVEIQMAPGGRFIAKGLNLKMLIQQAYNVRDFQISGAPSWAATDRYEINAKAADANVTRDDMKPMLQALLADRFRLVIRRETKDAPVYELVVAKGGPKLKESESTGERGDRVRMGRGMVDAAQAGMPTLTNMLSNILGRAVIDKTGLTKRYDFKLEWTPDESQGGLIRQVHPDAPPAPPVDSSGPSIYTALQEQLGLKLENTKGPVELLIIERVEKPTEN